MKILGIDPGKSGGVAILRLEGPIIERLLKMPETEADTNYLFQNYWETGSVAFMERIHAMPQSKGSGITKLAFHAGMLLGLLLANKYAVQEVTPSVWQKAMKCLSGGKKNVTKSAAQKLFPDYSEKITHATADALLIAEYGRRVVYKEWARGGHPAKKKRQRTAIL